MAKRLVEKYDFKPFGKAIKTARSKQKESRNKVGNEMYLSPRHNITSLRRLEKVLILREKAASVQPRYPVGETYGRWPSRRLWKKKYWIFDSFRRSFEIVAGC